MAGGAEDDATLRVEETVPWNTHIRFDSDSEGETTIPVEEEEETDQGGRTEDPDELEPQVPRLKTADIMDDHVVVDYLRTGDLPAVLSPNEKRRVYKRAQT